MPFCLIAFGIDGMTSGLAALLMSAGPFYAIFLSHIFTDDTEDGLMEQVFVNPEREDILFFSEPQYVIENLTPKPLP